ncbi:hypothetical protein [Luteibacter sp. dw_328]|uniref:hypothetical protein n=1 Tax=Luteibacter sp. dw_328 TaxID=2719796 RepID=UPI001BD4BAE3|nr:hypothetical protein [Luteibacter sp. dw_328]
MTTVADSVGREGDRIPLSARVYFIKLGEGGAWESLCLAGGTIKFGYHATPHDLCLGRNWEEVKAFWTRERKNAGTASNDTRQIRTYYEASEQDIFITFSKGYLWWCRPKGAPAVLADDDARLRKTVDGWRNTSLAGEPLLISRLSGKLTKTQMYQGTICEVEERSYLLRRLNDEKTPELAAVEATEQVLLAQVLAMVRLLTPVDFELMVELIFSTSGWRRQARTGGTQKTIDLDLLLPSTQERAFVQVKSRTTTSQFDGYADEFAGTDAHARMFYVWHTGTVDRTPPPRVTFWGPDIIAGRVLDAGLLGWLKDRIS